MSIADILFGRPIASSDEQGEQVLPAAGVPIFGLDALTSAAYGPEAALTLLIPLGLAGIHQIVPLTGAVLCLLVIVYFSYRQTIEAYPQGGGSYIVASENLGTNAGLLAAAALMIDYILTAAVGISAGVSALISALPGLQPHRLSICLGILLVLTLVNVRGVRDTGIIFMFPTYLFVGTLFGVILLGTVRVLMAHGGMPHAVIAPPPPSTATETVGLWLLLKAFASGCTAMTGIEAVSNGVTAFREPVTKNAKTTLTITVATLVILLAGIVLLCRAYHLGAIDSESSHYQSVLSMLTMAVAGRGFYYYLTMGAVLLALSFSANTAFADFPRLARAIASNNYLPHIFLIRGRRLLFSWGIYVLFAFTAIILILFRGLTDKLIALYAIGAFLAFTLSQAGMVVHWYKKGGAIGKLSVNLLGTIATAAATGIILVAKFIEGAWVTALLIPVLIFGMKIVHRHYMRVQREVSTDKPFRLESVRSPIVVIPIDRWSRIVKKALSFGISLSHDVRCVHVQFEGSRDEICNIWDEKIATPIHNAGTEPPQLIILNSPYRFVLTPILDYVLKLSDEMPDRQVCVLVPELVVKHWWQNLLHNQRADILKVMLLLRGNERVVVINVPWYLAH